MSDLGKIAAIAAMSMAAFELRGPPMCVHYSKTDLSARPHFEALKPLSKRQKRRLRRKAKS